MTPANYNDMPWQQQAGPTVFQPFPRQTAYFGDASRLWMVNFRANNLDAIINQLRNAGVILRGILLSCGNRKAPMVPVSPNYRSSCPWPAG